MVSGLYGEIYIGIPKATRIEYLLTRQRKTSKTTWELEVTAELRTARPRQATLEVALSGPRIEGVQQSKEYNLSAGPESVSIKLTVDNPELWWPSGYGEQPLYEVSISIDGASARKRIGFRELQTVVNDDERGRSMFFRVNGRDVFAKGANWIPCDALPGRPDVETYRALLNSAREANMNMLRVWGGGQYEEQFFYDLCDELGILVWHDFMFSCGTYPADKGFLSKVAEEITHQVKRLKDHPSIALWCGNNENLGALLWFPETQRFRDRYVVDYDRLYEATIGDLTEEIDPDRTYWPSSPSGGRGDYSDNWHDDTKGDMHYWSVWHEGKPFDGYYEVIPRFCSEFGYQSFPSLSAVEAFAPEDQRNLTSPVMEHHQKNRRGNTIIIESLSRYFRFPDGLANMLFLSQVQQAYAIRTAVEYWRSQRPVCMGALYWQLNDNWPVASWSSIEYGGKWKLLHYAAKRFYAPLHILGYVNEGGFQVWVCNDTAEAKKGECAIDFIDFEGHTAHSDRLPIEVPAGSARLAREYRLEELPVEAESVFAAMELRTSLESVSNETFLTYPKSCPIQRALVTATVEAAGDTLAVTLTTDKPSFYVSLDAGDLGGRFDDNCITLMPGAGRRLTFRPDDDRFSKGRISESDRNLFASKMVLHHLSDSYR
ncbi:MAG TPA: glycoside hydrolase family 2 protein [Spirochaetia bacterium]|nr:glycoside hydrolase family 2 protein [Spirochaetia bacterium]